MYLKIAYIALSFLMTMVIFTIGFKAIKSGRNPDKSSKNILMLVAGLVGWHIYLFIMARSGILRNYDFPPRFVLFNILPTFIFIGLFIYKNQNYYWIHRIPSQWLIFYQSFRVFIESIFVFSVAALVLHPNVTIEGYNYDMIFALTAPIMGYIFFRNKKKYRKLTIIWNFVGLFVIAIIIFLFLATIYFPDIFDEKTLPFPLEFTEYPYVLVPGFLMPSAVFMHVLSIVQLRKSHAGKNG